MSARVHSTNDRAGPIDAQPVLGVSVVFPDAVCGVDNHSLVASMRCHSLKHLQVSDENSLELGTVGLAVFGLTEIVEDSTGVDQSLNCSLCDRVG